MPKGDTLTVRQRRFAEHYVANRGNASEAYVSAGYSMQSTAAIGTESHKLLKNPKIRALITELQEEISKETLTEVKEILQEQRRIAFSDIKNVVDISDKGDISLKDFSIMPVEVSRSIQEISSTTTRSGSSLKVKLYDKLRALELLGKINGLDSDLNIALATFRRYGYEIQETEHGFIMKDSYKNNG